MRAIFRLFILLLALCIINTSGTAWALTESEILAGVEARIERYRMANATVCVANAKGEPVENAKVQIAQTNHAFLFGCNIFKLSGYPDIEREVAYEKQFAALFNFATLPFYWRASSRHRAKIPRPN